ncbi:MAG: hypothetical protein NC221_03615 [Duncaniella sp.]|nr:hypothetical protein [Duncaniella sp.]
MAEIQRILNNGTILNVTAEGLATSQDNFVGEDAVNVGLTRNKTLSFNRALSSILWLKNSNKFKNVPASEFVINELSEPIGQVNDKSTRDLNAKLKRCAIASLRTIIKSALTVFSLLFHKPICVAIYGGAISMHVILTC